VLALVVSIREGSLERDRVLVVDFLKNNLTEESSEKRFEWLYCMNPCGVARIWVAFDGATGETIGTAASFPRRFSVGEKEAVALILGDFALDRRFRSLGPALMLQKACLKPVLEGEVPFCYDHPSSAMMAVYKRLGIGATGQVRRFVKPLRVDRKVQAILGQGIVTRGASGFGNWFLRVKGSRIIKEEFGVEPLKGRFSDEFDELDDRISGSFRVYGRRKAEYLNWRYRDDPLRKFEALTVRKGKTLEACTVFRRAGRDGLVFEAFGDDREGAVRTVLAATLEKLKQSGVETVSVPALESSPVADLMKRTKFFPREAHPFVVCSKAGSDLAAIVENSESWFYTHGDRD
jgi:hypothetical protein